MLGNILLYRFPLPPPHTDNGNTYPKPACSNQVPTHHGQVTLQDLTLNTNPVLPETTSPPSCSCVLSSACSGASCSGNLAATIFRYSGQVRAILKIAAQTDPALFPLTQRTMVLVTEMCDCLVIAMEYPMSATLVNYHEDQHYLPDRKYMIAPCLRNYFENPEPVPCVP